MKNVRSQVIARPVKVVLNTSNKKRAQWARIEDARTGEHLHTGQVGYIKGVARKRYNVVAEL